MSESIKEKGFIDEVTAKLTSANLTKMDESFECYLVLVLK